MPDLYDYASEGRIASIPSGMSDGLILVRPEDFAFSRSILALAEQYVDFICWFTVDGESVDGTDKCIHMADPALGKFVFYEIKGVPIPFKDIDGCRFRLIQGNVIHDDVYIDFYGFKIHPKRCYTVDDRMTSRAFAQWNLTNDSMPKPAEMAIRSVPLNIADRLKNTFKQ